MLCVWLPLNGDLHNQGLSDLTVTNTGATVNNYGKIGKCYSFNGSNNYIQGNYKFYNNKYSVCAWIYSTSSSATQTICCERTAVGSGFSTFLISGKLRIDPGGNNAQWTTNYTYPINTWFHLCITYDGTTVRYYINGQFQESANYTIASSYWSNIISIGASQANGSNYANYLNGKLNDIRIYDHCLSDKEVEEIAKGLVLHYKLDNIIENNIYDSSGYNNNGIISGNSFALSENTIRYSNSISLPADNWIRVLSRPTIVCPHDTITVNIWANIAASWTYNRGCIISCQESGGWAIGRSSSNNLYFEIYADGAYRATLANASYTNGIFSEWHMFTGTADKSYIRFFLDGQLISESENTTTADFSYYNNYIFIGAEARANTVTPYASINGLFSDFRIYAAALTNDQIKELYDTSVTIDNKGNIYSREYIEDDDNLNITKSGLFQSSVIHDDDNLNIASILKTEKQIQGNTLYEY